MKQFVMAPRVGGWMAAVLIATGLAVAQAHVVQQDPNYSGPLLILSHLFGLVVTLALLTICYGVGSLALQRIGLVLKRPLELFVFCIAVGGALVSFSMLVLGSVALLTPVPLALTFLGLAILARRELARIPRLFQILVQEARQSSVDRVYATLAAVVMIAVAAFLLTQSLMPPGDWDSLMYHLEIPRLFLLEGRIFLPEDNLHVAYVGLVHMLYVPLIALGGNAAPALLSAFFALLLGIAVFTAGARFFGSPIAAIATALLWATSSLLLVAITARLDVTLACYLFLGHYALLITHSARSDWRHFYLAAFLLGAAVGIKYHALVYLMGLAPVILWIAYSRNGQVIAALRPLMVFGVVLTVTCLPWLLKNWVLLGAPLYPFFADRLLQPWLATLHGQQSIPADVSLSIFNALPQARENFNLLDLFSAPGRLTVEQEGAYYFQNPLFLALPLTLLLHQNRQLFYLLLPPLLYVLVAIIAFPQTNLRYLIPAAAPLTVVVAWTLVELTRRLLSTGAARLLVLGVSLVALFPSGKTAYTWMKIRDVTGYLAGKTSEREFTAKAFPFYFSLTDTVNRLVPSDGKVLLLLEARGYHFKPTVLQDNVLTNWPLVAPVASTGNCLEQVGITHVLVSMGAFRYYVLRGMDPAILRFDLFPSFAQACLEEVHRSAGFILYNTRQRSMSGTTDIGSSGQGQER